MNWNVFKLGIKNLLLHKLRSLLTVLGVILGVGAVIALLAVGEGSKKEALERIRSLGANNVIIRSIKPQDQSELASGSSGEGSTRISILEYGLTYDDFERLKATLPTVKTSVPIAMIVNEASFLHRRMNNARILGTTPGFLPIKNLRLAKGRFITDVDIKNTWNVAVLAAGAANRLFNFEDPIGKHVLLGSDVYRIVGVLDSQATGNATPGGFGQSDFNEDIYIPISCAGRRFGELQEIRSAGSQSFEMNELSEITLTVQDDQFVSQTAAMAKKLLVAAHPEENDF
ncbi:MAG: ABC transporter permease, partial [Planctomycetota bacterium]